MSKFYKDKPYWQRPEKTRPRVLEATRTPSGEWAFSGREYTPPAVNDRGYRKGRSVPNTQPSGMNKFGKQNMMKQRMASMLNKANIAFAVADSIPGIMDYGWDDFMEGRAPPPFDFLNVPIPPEWLPVKTPDESRPMPPGSFTFENEDGTFYSFPPAYESWGGLDVAVSGVPEAWPPPGTSTTFDTNGEVKASHISYSSYLWTDVNTDITTTLTATYFTFPGGYGPAWRKTIYRYTGVHSGIASDRTYQIQRENYYWPRVVGQPAPVKPLEDDRNIVGMGSTAEESLTIGSPGRVVFAPVLPSLHRFKHPYENLLKQIAGTRVVDIPAYIDVGFGGSRTIIPPRGPVIHVPTKPGEPPHPPGDGTKERKRLVGGAAFFFTRKLFHGITEYQDALDALFEALPRSLQKSFKGRGPVLKSLFLFQHLDKVDISDAIVNLAWNQFEDYVIGTQLFARNKRAAEARGDRYGFRTLNSANNFGGLEELGAVYGDFSKQYVNPTKDDLSRFLSERFGI